MALWRPPVAVLCRRHADGRAQQSGAGILPLRARWLFFPAVSSRDNLPQQAKTDRAARNAMANLLLHFRRSGLVSAILVPFFFRPGGPWFSSMRWATIWLAGGAASGSRAFSIGFGTRSLRCHRQEGETRWKFCAIPAGRLCQVRGRLMAVGNQRAQGRRPWKNSPEAERATAFHPPADWKKRGGNGSSPVRSGRISF